MNALSAKAELHSSKRELPSLQEQLWSSEQELGMCSCSEEHTYKLQAVALYARSKQVLAYSLPFLWPGVEVADRSATTTSEGRTTDLSRHSSGAS